MPHSKPNAEGFKVYRSSIRDCRCQNYLVPCRSLADICAEHAPRDIHFLKIDVEGMERSVLEGSDFKHFRPWLLAIEATVPCTYTPCHEEWEHIALDMSLRCSTRSTGTTSRANTPLISKAGYNRQFTQMLDVALERRKRH